MTVEMIVELKLSLKEYRLMLNILEDSLGNRKDNAFRYTKLGGLEYPWQDELDTLQNLLNRIGRKELNRLSLETEESPHTVEQDSS